MPDAFHYVVKSPFEGHEVGARLDQADAGAAIEQGHEHQLVRVAGPMPVEEK
jgi:hypothetical protein